MQIINPWIFYLIYTLGSVRCLAFAIFMFIGIVCIVGYFLTNEEQRRKVKRAIKRIGVPIVVVCVTIITFVPSEKVMYTMLVSSYVTTDNLEKATEVIQDGVDYIFDKLDSDEGD